MSFWMYILKCSDGKYYTGHTDDLEKRIDQPQSGLIEGYTHSRLPVKLVAAEEFPTRYEALSRERQVKGWTRVKKEALIMQDYNKLPELSKSYPSTGSGRTDFLVTLREACDSDAPIIAEQANDYDVAKMVATMPHPYSLADAYVFLEKIKDKFEAGEGHTMAIAVDGDLAGCAGWFYNEEHVLEIGYWVGRKFWGRGIAGKAVVLILDVIRNECPDETEVLAQYMDENPASGRVLEKCGFVPDGITLDGCYSLARDEVKPALRMIKKL